MQPTPAPTSPGQSPEPNAPPASQAFKPPPPNVDSAPFSVLVNLFEKLQTERKQEKRRKMLENWFAHWRKEKGYDLYPVLRLLLPQKDRERAVYKVGEKVMAQDYRKLLGLEGSKDYKNEDGEWLLNWKRPNRNHSPASDFPTALYSVISQRIGHSDPKISIDEVHGLLDDLAKYGGNAEKRQKVFRRIYEQCTAVEQLWIARAILKDMSISIKEATIFAVFHPDAQDLYNTCSDLKKVAYELWDPSKRLKTEDKHIQLFQPFTPMLCQRPTSKIEETVLEMGGAEFIIEEKLDGERMQLHKRGNEYFYCSRKGKDYTYLYGKHIGSDRASLTPFIDSAFDSRIDNIILDGEMLVWDPAGRMLLPFGHLKTAAQEKMRRRRADDPHPVFKVFDLVYLNGQDLTHRRTSFRKKNLRLCIKEIKGRIEFASEFKGRTAKDVREKMDEVMANRGEGLVIKHPDAQYVLNGRNSDWIKVKPEYMDNMGETVDVAVVAANYGKGHRSGGVSTFICALFDDRNPDQDNPKYRSFVRIGTGLSYDDYDKIRQKPWKTWDPKNPPRFLSVAKKGNEDKGDVYLEPDDMFMIRVKAAEITPSDQYHMGYTMRFPRALGLREDLSVGDCMTDTNLFDMVRSDKKRKMEANVEIESRKKRKVLKAARKAVVVSHYGGTKRADVAVKTNILDDMKFLVMSDPKSRTSEKEKAELVKLIYANGGVCAQTTKKYPDLYVVYGGTTTPYDLKLIIEKGNLDVIKPEWITDSIEAGEPVPMRKKYFFHATEARAANEEYQTVDTDYEDEDEDEDAEQPAASATASSAPEDEAGSATASDTDSAQDKGKGKAVDVKPKLEDMYPDMAEWFKVDENAVSSSAQDDKDDGVLTDADSDNDDNEDVVDLEEYFRPREEGEDDGEDDAGEDEATKTVEDEDVEAEAPEVKMGETDDAMEYDQDLIFKHLCFYLDTVENASTNNIPVKPNKKADEVKQKFAEIETLITKNGGKIVGLDNPKLTHVVLDKRDPGRRLELMRRTAKPKRRHLVISEFIEACLEEETLLNEDEFMP